MIPVFFHNEDVLRLFDQAGIVAPGQGRVMPGSGVDLERFAPFPDDRVRNLPLSFLFIGRFLRDKGINEFIDLRSATAQLHRALKRGGVALITVPGISPIDHGEWKDSWCWSLTDVALRRLLDEVFGQGQADVSSFGNLLAATAFLHGAAVEEVGRARLKRFDAAFPVTVAARVVRAA